MQNQTLGLFSGTVLATVALVFSYSSRADCDPMAVMKVLEDGGWRFEAETDEIGQGYFTITSGGLKAQAQVERDGDTQFIAYYVDTGLTRQESLEYINEVSSKLNHVQLWLDEDGDLAMNYSIAEWDNVCPDNFSEHVKLFFSLMGAIEELRPEN